MPQRHITWFVYLVLLLNIVEGNISLLFIDNLSNKSRFLFLFLVSNSQHSLLILMFIYIYFILFCIRFAYSLLLNVSKIFSNFFVCRYVEVIKRKVLTKILYEYVYFFCFQWTRDVNILKLIRSFSYKLMILD